MVYFCVWLTLFFAHFKYALSIFLSKTIPSRDTQMILPGARGEDLKTRLHKQEAIYRFLVKNKLNLRAAIDFIEEHRVEIDEGVVCLEVLRSYKMYVL